MTTIMQLDLNQFLPSVPDFPKPGIVFRDIGPLLADAAAFTQSIREMARLSSGLSFDGIAGIESRGLIFAAALSMHLGKPLIPVRKHGKLPPPVAQARYALEYGTDALEIQRRSIAPGSGILLVDDVIATGGTVLAAAQIVTQLGARVSGVVALLGIQALDGAARLRKSGLDVHIVLPG
jgi:adenine phosphoribosyltransferase